MKTYYIFNGLGEYLRTVNTPEADAKNQIELGEILVESEYPLTGTSFYFDTVLQKIVNMPVRPSTWHKFNYVTKNWEDTRSLRDYKMAKWEEIKRARDIAIDSPLSTPNGIFDSDADSRSSIVSAVLLMQTLNDPEQVINFTRADNTVATLNTKDMVEIGVLLGQKVQLAHTRGRLLRSQIDQATSIDDLNSLSW